MNQEAKILQILVAHKIEEDKARELLSPLQELNNSHPKLSNEEVVRIANEVTDRFLEMWGPMLNRKDTKAMREKIYSVVFLIAIGLVTSGIFTLLVYLSGKVMLLFAHKDRDPEELRRQAEEEARVLKPLSVATREKLREEGLILSFFPKRFMRDIEKQVRVDKVIQEFHNMVKYKWQPELELKTCADSLVGLIHEGLVRCMKQKLATDSSKDAN